MDEKKTNDLRVDLVDNWHPRWREVLQSIDHLGQRQHVRIDGDEWLSARHNLLVAFADEDVAGHVSFRVQPVNGDDGCVLMERGRPVVEAQLESLAVQPGFSVESVRKMLWSAAEQRARALRCRRVIGLQ